MSRSFSLETLKRVVAHGENLNLLTVLLDNPHAMGRIIRNDKNEIVGIVEEEDATVAQKSIRETNTNCLCASARQFEPVAGFGQFLKRTK